MMENTEPRKAEKSQSEAVIPNPKYMTAEEDSLLFRLKESTSLSWPKIAAYFPHRKQASLQVRYYRAVRKRRDQKSQLSADKLVVKNSAASSDRTISASSEKSHLSRAAKQKVQLPAVESYSISKSSRRFDKSSGDYVNNELASNTNSRSPANNSKNEKSTIRKSKGKKAKFTKKSRSTVTEHENCNSNDKNFSAKRSNGIEANSKRKREIANTDNEDKNKRTNKRPRLEAEEAQVNNDSPKVPQSNIADDSSKNKRPLTRGMADKSKKADSLYNVDNHKEPVANDGITDLKADANRAKKTSNRNPPYTGSCSPGWVPVPPLSPSDPRYPGIIPKVFVYPPPTRIIEYHTGSGSFRIRSRRPSDDLRVGALVLRRGTPVYKPSDPRHPNYEGDRQRAETEAEKAAACMGESFKTTKFGVMSPISEKGSDENTLSDDDEDD